MNLLQYTAEGVTLSSGAKSHFKIECDALTDDDIKTGAYLIHKMVSSSICPFNEVVPVPSTKGGIDNGRRLSEALEPYAFKNHTPGQPFTVLVVDDVLTSGKSMEKVKRELLLRASPKVIILGAVLFARATCPSWIQSVFQMSHFLTFTENGNV